MRTTTSGKGLALDQQRRQTNQQLTELRGRVDRLTVKERQVLDLIVEGRPNKTMATTLDVSLRAIENRRRSVFAKLHVDTVAELVALVLRLRDSPRTDSAGAITSG